MTDELEDLFLGAIETFPDHLREEAQEWFSRANLAVLALEKILNGED